MRGSPLACLRAVLGEGCGESKPVACCTCPRWSRCAPVRLGGAGVSVGVLCFWGVVWGLLALLSLLHPPSPQSKDSFNWEHAKRVKSSLRNSVVMETSCSVIAASGEPLWKWGERTCVSSDSHKSRSLLSHSTPVHQPEGSLGLEADGMEWLHARCQVAVSQTSQHGLSDPCLLHLQGSNWVHGHLPGEPVMPASAWAAGV